MKEIPDMEDIYRSTPQELPEYTTEGINPRALEETFAELLWGIAISAIAAVIILAAALPQNRPYHIIGLMVGVILSFIMAFYLRKSVTDAISTGEYGAEKVIKKGALIRYGITCIVLGVLMIFPIGNPLTAFCGVMTLKVAAYIQPFTNKFLKIFKLRR